MRPDALGVFGAGAELDKTQWRGVFRQLVALGLLVPDAEGFGTLQLSAASRGVLKGEQTVWLRRQADRAARRVSRRQARGARAGASAQMTAEQAPLWAALRNLRGRLAREQGVPAYVIFHDATLLAMLQERPKSPRELGTIAGVGAAKLERYGAAFLEVLRDGPA